MTKTKLPKPEEIARRLIAAEDELVKLRADNERLAKEREKLMRDFGRHEEKRERHVDVLHVAANQAISDLRQAIQQTGGTVEDAEDD